MTDILSLIEKSYFESLWKKITKSYRSPEGIKHLKKLIKELCHFPVNALDTTILSKNKTA